MRLVDDVIFFRCPRSFVDVGIEVVVPAFATLLSNAALEVFGDQSPTFRSVLGN